MYQHVYNVETSGYVLRKDITLTDTTPNLKLASVLQMLSWGFRAFGIFS